MARDSKFELQIGQVVDGVVYSMFPFGVFVELTSGSFGLLKVVHVDDGPGKTLPDVGTSVRCVVIDVVQGPECTTYALSQRLSDFERFQRLVYRDKRFTQLVRSVVIGKMLAFIVSDADRGCAPGRCTLPRARANAPRRLKYHAQEFRISVREHCRTISVVF